MSSKEAKVDAIMKMIKNLPDDMIIEIKGYVINPYKFHAELKLYKAPYYKYCISNMDNNMVLQSINHSRGFDFNYLNNTNHSTYEKNQVLDTCRDIMLGRYSNYNTEVLPILKDLKIKGRTKLIQLKTYEKGDSFFSHKDFFQEQRRNKAIVRAIIKSNN